MKYEIIYSNVKIQLVTIFNRLNVINILLCTCQQKIVKLSIVWLKRIDEVDILHTKIYSPRLEMSVGNFVLT
jgi:hypothetical protein